MAALESKADLMARGWNVRFVPEADTSATKLSETPARRQPLMFQCIASAGVKNRETSVPLEAFASCLMGRRAF